MLTFRPATILDVPLIHTMILQLAVFERLEHLVTSTPEKVQASLFPTDRQKAAPGYQQKTAFALLAMLGSEVVAFTIYFYNYSTFTGTHGLYVEDIFVLEEHRSGGIGEQVFRHLAGIALANNCMRMEWSVLDWNVRARDFYKRLGSEEQNGWVGNRVDGDRLLALAKVRNK